MRHLFVESNWVYASCAPEHLREPAAVLLLQKARNGELLLQLPALCLREGADAVRKKCQPRIPEEMRKFLRAARLGDKLSVEHSEIVTQALELYRSTVSHELSRHSMSRRAYGCTAISPWPELPDEPAPATTRLAPPPRRSCEIHPG
ncbi:hypothetical protein [Archangium sp.]|uniref:hypothetical protein n=1 Tax=Archangium sp. TaxID=1872627 RepID=UPI002D3D01C7|nr:hypothetical protein [Archangium sp.]HYO58045.1 hypothetical protein [Archangium sp.]